MGRNTNHMSDLTPRNATRGSAEFVSEDRLAKVQEAVREWASQLVDLSGRNQLLFYRKLKRGTLEFLNPNPETLGNLISGREVRLSDLARTEADDPNDAIARCKTIHKKSREHLEERGLNTLYMAFGLATWTTESTQSTPAAPVLLRPLSLRPTGAASPDFFLKLEGEWTLNAVLADYARHEFGLDPAFDAIEEGIDLDDDAPTFAAAFAKVSEKIKGMPDFTICQSLIVGNFAYAKLPMVLDLQQNVEQLAKSDMIAAIAGDTQTRNKFAESQGEDTNHLHPDYIQPSDEFLVLDADSSQNFAINRALTGQSIVIQGPPGTGKSQTIANIIAASAARGRRVLFVAEKKAAIDAVASRLKATGLESLLMNLHGTTKSRKQVCDDLEASIQQAGLTKPVSCDNTWQQLERTRASLIAHVESLHRRHAPWDVSLFEVQGEILSSASESGLKIGIAEEAVLPMSALDMEEAASHFEEWALLSEALRSGRSPWSGIEASQSLNPQELSRKARALQLQHLPAVATSLGNAQSLASMEQLQSLAEVEALFQALGRAGEVLAQSRPTIFQRDLEDDIRQIKSGARSFIHHFLSAAFSPAYRKKIGSLRELLREKRRLLGPSLSSLLKEAKTVLEDWKERALPLPPRTVPGVEDALVSLKWIRKTLTELQAIGFRHDFMEMSLEDAERVAEQLTRNEAHVLQLPRIAELSVILERAGIRALDALPFDAKHTPDRYARAYREAWFSRVRDHILQTDASLAAFHGLALHTTSTRFSHSDREHIETTPNRIKRLVAEKLVEVRNYHRTQDTFIRAQARRKRGHASIRDLVKQAPDVLLAARPCWAMSPLQVSQLLPAEAMFETVIFDEASQVLPADAIPAIMRAEQVVVAGDAKQLPPTTFFVGQNDEDDTEDQDDGGAIKDDESFASGFESILDVAESTLPERMHSRLRWHYRSRDERLISFSNAHIYDRSLTTFPGSLRQAPLSLTVVESKSGAINTRSSPAEVDRVVELAIEHAAQNPKRSLGIIAMGDYHANRIETALARAIQSQPLHVRKFFDHDAAERTFVKNIERVQGDERDVIILSIGYSKDANGNLAHRFGPLTQDKGERRLNVAASRARHEMKVVSSFVSDEVDLNRSKARGVQLLKEFLSFAASGGNDLGSAGDVPPLNPFEISVRNRLEAAGIRAIPQYGSSGYRIDFAIPHPDRPNEMLLAVEADGAAYHSAQSARDRDRLRQSVLESLGWRFVRIWSTDWFNDPDSQVKRVELALSQALKGEAADTTPASATSAKEEEKSETPLPTVPRRSRQRSGRPRIQTGKPIQAHPERALVSLVEWIQSDGVLRTDHEILDEMIRELGYARRGKQIVAALDQAINSYKLQK